AAPLCVPQEDWFAAPPPPEPPPVPAVVWEGTIAEVQSLAVANRGLCSALVAAGHDVCVLDVGPQALTATRTPWPAALAARRRVPALAPAAHVRHQWPPRPEPPPAGAWVLLQPSEFGVIPEAWLDLIGRGVDEVWAYTEYVRRCYLDSGVPADMVHVVPLGVDPDLFRPDAPPRARPLAKGFQFLFVGGSLRRKGVDLLLAAFTAEFRPDEDVGLVIKDMGAETFYRGQTAAAAIRAHQDAGAAIVHLTADIPAEEMPGLYTAADCLVHPYRGEGFGLPVAEAMACGLPVIVTAGGATDDFCTDATAYRIPAGRVPFPEDRIDNSTTRGRPWWLEPEPAALRAALRAVVTERDAARARGAAAAAAIRAGWTWDHAAAKVTARLTALARRTPRRLRAAPAPVRTPATLASIVVVAHNGLDDTRRCLESVVRHTRPPFELVLVDNGSTDATPAYFADLLARLGKDRVRLVRLGSNRGFAAGVNAGLGVAAGDWVVLLNNDTVVTPGWLDGLCAAAGSDARVGLVGPRSHGAPPPQFLAAEYGPDLAGLDAQAARVAAAGLGRGQPVPRLTGFCLAVRRAVFDAVGTLDEGFGLGFFEDDDLVLRARQAGWTALLAEGVYIHHAGSRTFAALGVDTVALLTANHGRFRAKWGAAADSYQRVDAGSAPPYPARTGRPTVALCVIAKNEEENLPDCLAAETRALFDEVVVVDTGSTDATVAVAASLGARVAHFPWVNSFAAARNASLDAASADWVFWLDADDRLDAPNRDRLRTLLAGLRHENAAYVMKCHCVPVAPGAPGTLVDHVRLFPRHPEVRWRYRVHEQILPALRARGAEVRWADVRIDHVGYVDPALVGRKRQRDLALLEEERAERPGDPFVLFNLGQVYLDLGRVPEALGCLQESLRRSDPGASIVRKLHALIAAAHLRAGRPAEALAACVAGRADYADDAELLFLEGQLRLERGEAAASADLFRTLVTGDEEPHFASVNASLRGPQGRERLAAALRALGRLAEAEAQLRTALVAEPAHLPSWRALALLKQAQDDAGGLEAALAELERLAPVEALLLRGEGHLDRGEYGAARRLFAEAAAAAPEAVRPRVLLSYALLQEDCDRPAAERCLEDILRLDPHHAEARHNLGVLRGQPEPGTR
ncbi:MAG: glycosyltransferase, partial [Gemmataceae bacterium]